MKGSYDWRAEYVIGLLSHIQRAKLDCSRFMTEIIFFGTAAYGLFFLEVRIKLIESTLRGSRSQAVEAKMHRCKSDLKRLFWRFAASNLILSFKLALAFRKKVRLTQLL